MPPQSIQKAVSGNDILSESVGRVMSHLKANEIDLEENPIRMGPMLDFDLEREWFTDEQSE